MSRLLVIGTSNTLVRGGWYDALVATYLGTVERIALGGAPFSQFLAVLPQVKAHAPDHIILECSPNDEAYSNSIGNEVFVDRLYFMLLSSLRSIAPLTVFRIPPEANLSKSVPIWQRQIQIAEQLGCQVLDGSADIVEISGDRAPYRDKYHPITEVAHILGQRVALSLAQPSSPMKVCDYSMSFAESHWPAVSGETNSINTSLLQETFNVLPAGKGFALPKPKFLLGFFVNSGETACVLRVSGPHESRDIFCFYMQPLNKDVKRFVPLYNGMIVKGINAVFPHKSINLALHTDIFNIQQKASLGSMLIYDGWGAQ